MKDLLKEIKDRLEKATEGPWKRCHHLTSKEQDESCPCGFPGDIWGADEEHVVCTMGSLPDPKGGYSMAPPRYKRDQELANAELIAHAPSDLAKLIKALRLAIAGLEMAADNASFEGDIELADAHIERLKEIQQIMCGGGND